MSKKKYIETPEKLWGLFISYREWAKSNPRLKEDYVGKDADRVERKLERPLSWVGFECWLYENDIISELSDYEQNQGESYTAYLPIISHIKKCIQADQTEGAAVGLYQQNIIARMLGLVDKKDVTTNGEPVKTIINVGYKKDGRED